jgi:hypothetical protein
MKMSVEHWWNDTDREKQVLREKPVPVPLSHMKWVGIETRPLQFKG